jgi:undecaprenyl-diphosphatase
VVLTEMDDVGGVIVTSFTVVFVIVAAASYTETQLAGPRRPPVLAPPAEPAPRASGRRAWLGQPMVAGLGLGAASFVLLLVVMLGLTLDLDGATLPAFTAVGDTSVGHWGARVLVMGGQTWLVGSALAGAAAWNSWRTASARPLWLAGASLAGLSVALWLLKVAAHRSAPHSGANTVLEGGMSYPSGHAAIATLCMPLVMVLLASAQPHWRITRRPVRTGAVGAFIVGLCTVVLGYHWVSDAVGGWLIGSALVVPTLMLLRRPTVAREPVTEPAESR